MSASWLCTLIKSARCPNSSRGLLQVPTLGLIGFRNVISSGLGICQSLAGATVVDFAGLPTNDDETPGLGVRSELHSMF